MSRLIDRTRDTWLSTHRPELALLALRLAFASVYIVHGYLKYEVKGISGMTDLMSELGFPAPYFFAVIFTNWELVFGILIAIGLFSRFSTGALGLLIVVIVLTTTWPPVYNLKATGAEANMLALATAVALTLLGPGRWSLDAVRAQRRTARTA